MFLAWGIFAEKPAEMIGVTIMKVVEMTYTSKEMIDYLIKSVGSEFGRSIFTKEFKAAQAGDTPSS